MTALIADDEPLARALLRGMLESESVEVVGEAEYADAAITQAAEVKPDVVFLDVRMPGIPGIRAASVFAQLPVPPLVVLVTGYSEYAVEAFQKDVFDYLLKPVPQERLGQTLSKAQKQIVINKALRRDDRSTPRRMQVPRLPIRTETSYRLVPIDSVLSASTVGKAVIVKTRKEQFRTSYTLSHLEQLLTPGFMRVHASCIVNLAAIDEILILGSHTYSVRLIGGEELPVARSQYAKLQARLGFTG